MARRGERSGEERVDEEMRGGQRGESRAGQRKVLL